MRLARRLHVVELKELVNDRVFVASRNPFRNTGPQMAFEEKRFELLKCFAHGMSLVQDVDTVLVLFNHLTNTTQIPFNIPKSVANFLLFSSHSGFLSFLPSSLAT